MWLRGGIPIGRLFNIRLQIDWSIIFIIALVTMSLASGVFQSWHPDWSAQLRWLTAVSAALLLFVSILLHELSHALVAKAYGIEVKRITLFIFGGMANIEHDPDSPKKEALMALVGPLVSMVLGVSLIILASMAVVPSASNPADPLALVQSLGPLPTLFAWLGPINLLLGVFNLIPGFPLDGGRVLRALLWKITGNLRKATRIASGCGQALGWLLIATGIVMAFGTYVPFLGTGLISGLWLAFIGWFLSSAARAGYYQLLARETLEDVPLRRLVARDGPPIVPAAATLNGFIDDFVMPTDWRVFRTTTSDGKPALLQPYQLREVPKAHRAQTTVAQLATPVEQLPNLNINQTAYDALRAFGRHGDAWLAVVDDGGSLVGVVRRQDIGLWLELELQDEGPKPFANAA